MREGLTGWDALEGDLLQAAGLQVQGSNSAERSATQVAVDALSGLLQDGAFRYTLSYAARRLAKHPHAMNSACMGLRSQQFQAFLRFVALSDGQQFLNGDWWEQGYLPLCSLLRKGWSAIPDSMTELCLCLQEQWQRDSRCISCRPPVLAGADC